MTSLLACAYPADAANPADKDRFFDAKREIPILKEFSYNRECTSLTFPPSCDVNLFFGFFFDGTNNNLKRDHKLHSHSNVARLYRAFPGGKDRHDSEAWPDLKSKYYNYFRTYIPGVGTEFADVSDTGEGAMRTKGLAFAYMGENRIIWALVEAINNVHRYYLDFPLIDAESYKATFNHLTLPPFADTQERFIQHEFAQQPNAYEKLKSAFTDALAKLHKALDSFLPSDAPRKSKDKGKVIMIYFSLFGFSRGAAEARAFANWLVWLCELDAGMSGRAGLSLASIPLTFDFMGLFDTVASVGPAASMPLPGAHGHYAWADAGSSLRCPSPGPAQCLHIVSGHEVRRSFPLDSLSYTGTLAPGCTEIVFPGVHSDIGGGYKPMEQGRGKDKEGADMLSRLTLATMYRAARLAGVPFKLEDAPESVQRAFRIDPDLIRTFNAYIAYCANVPASGPLHKLMEQQHKLYIQWRKLMLGRMNSLPSLQAGDPHDKEDIEKADQELKNEVARFLAWRDRDVYRDDGQQNRPDWPEWTVIDDYWDEAAPPSSVMDLFDRFVHDSRAWFKPLGKDVGDLQLDMEKLVVREEELIEWEKNPVGDPPRPLARAEKEKLARYKPYRGQPDVRDGITPESKGREPYATGGGFLRFRKMYMGSDWFKPAGAVYAGLAPAGSANKTRLATDIGRGEGLAA